ncbi:MAG: flagellar motor switch protein FliN [Alphaproteobacteria bacterium]
MTDKQESNDVHEKKALGDLLKGLDEEKDKNVLEEEGKTQGVHIKAVYNVPVQIYVVLGKTTMTVSDLLKLGHGSVIELDKQVGEVIDVYVNNQLVARGEIIIVDGKLGITLTEMVQEYSTIGG